ADLLTSFTTLPLALLAVLALLAGLGGAVGVVLCLWTGATTAFVAALSLLLPGLGGVVFAAASLGVYLARGYRTVAGGPTGWVLRCVLRPAGTVGSRAGSVGDASHPATGDGAPGRRGQA